MKVILLPPAYRRQTTPCEPDEKFRRADGRCNNLENPDWGSAGSTMPRILPNAYDVDPDCCTNEQPECFNIPIPQDDEYFTDRNCMPLVRSTTTDVNGVAEQSNSLTAYIDGSMVYGSSAEHMAELRDSDGGRLKDVVTRRHSYLPPAVDAACRNETGEHCFEAGDERVNEQPGLAAIHTIFMREHNRLADGLRRRNRNWDSDQIFEVRFGHSLIPEELAVNNQVLMFKDLFFKPTAVLNSMDRLTESICGDEAMAMDRQFSHSVTRHLFQEEERRGFDLVALNLQRGRDHGLQPLNAYRKICSGTPFTDLSQLFPDDATAQAVYE
ncbi:peroxidase [Elysia marginata]|uniref:Peroxidase n=1 Tax=Elysia marginata TaxID=1093978 RepID=A0AAV4F488_9GAST|nr:peroxidase [Elysia marginata]